MISFPRQTVTHDLVFEGLGLHSGVPVRVTVRPGEQGIAFRLGEERVVASPANVTDTRRCTTLGPVATVEHLMSAFGGLGVTDAEVEVTTAEMPALDGGAAEYVEAILGAGLAPLGEATLEGPYARVFFHDGPVRIAVAKGEGRWRFTFETGERWPGTQTFECLLSPEEYAGGVAPARTLAFEEEVEPARAAGLGLGLDERTVLVLGREGYVNEPHFPDEPARHKTLDLIGDLYLTGVPVGLLSVTAQASGHRTNVEAARRLAAAVTIRR